MDIKYKVFSSAIIHELLDDEVIIANLDSGAYYSLRGSAVVMWQMLVSGYPESEITALVSQKYSVFAQDLLNSLNHFISLLCKEGLLASLDANLYPKTETVDLSWPSQWEVPHLEKYDEMKNLLMLDPVHEVDEQGWPSRSEKM